MTRRKGILPALAMAVLFAYSLWNYLRHPLNSSSSNSSTSRIVPQEPPVEVAKSLVPLEAHIMSKCPDARVRNNPCRYRIVMIEKRMLILSMFRTA